MSEIGPESHELQEQTLAEIDRISDRLTDDEKRLDQHGKLLNFIGLSTAILSALAAFSSMKAGYLANQALIAQVRASDQWSLYQGKSTKEHIERTAFSLETLIKPGSANFSRSEEHRLAVEKEKIRSVAKEYEERSLASLEQHEDYARAVASFQIAISLGAVAALTKKRLIWILGLGVGLFGLVVISPLPSILHLAPGSSETLQKATTLREKDRVIAGAHGLLGHQAVRF
jgi:hypothetical protein